MEEERVYLPEERLPAPEPEKEEEEEESVEDISDLTAPTREQILGKKDINSEPDDLSDLFEVSEEDVMGEKPEEEEGEKPEKEEPHWADADLKRFEESRRPRVVRKPLIRRTTKPFIPPPSIGGIR